MSVPMFYNEITNQWEPIVTSDRLPIVDLGKNYDSDNLEGALQEIAKWKNDIGSGSLGLLGERMDKAESDIEWLKVNGGGGGSGAVAPTITSTIPENTEIKLNSGDKLDIPIIFSSANLGQGICYIMIDNVEVNTQTIKQGSNTINIGTMDELKSTLTLYAKDRAGLVSNSLSWTVINGGIDLDVRFDSTADYTIGTEIIVPYYITTGSTKQLTANITIDYDKKTEKCSNGYNDYSITGLGVGIHTVKIQITDGEYDSQEVTFNVIVIDSSKLYLTTDFDNSDQTYGVPISINYRISYGETDKFPVNLYLDGTLYKQLESPRGNYYWVIDERLDIGSHTYKIELVNGSETLNVEGTFKVVQGEYTPVELAQNGLIYRLNPSTRTNTDKDRASCIINGCQTDLHNFNFSSNGWVDGELVCNTGSYVEIDFKPYLSNATSGSTVEIYFKSFDTGNDNAMIVDYRDENTDKGFYIGLNECGLFSESNSGISFVCPDKYIKVSFVIDRFNKFAKIYIDGILSRAFRLTDSGSGVSTIYENFAHNAKMYINYNTRDQSEGYCIIKDIVAYRRALTDDEIVKNGLFYETDMRQQQLDYNFEFNNTSLPQIRMYASEEEIAKMTLEHKITMRIKYTSTNTEKYGQSFDLPYCQVGWQGTSSIAYVLKNYQVYLKDENMADYLYTPFPNGVPESTFCFKADYMESSHSRNVGLARLATDIIFADVKNPSQQENPKVRNSIDGFPVLLYINDELKGVYDFNTDRYSYKAWGYTNEDTTLSYEISANSDSTAGAFFPYDSSTSGTTELNYYKSDFMPIYPPTRVAGNDNYNEIKRLVDYVGKAEEDNFKDNFEKYFNKEYVFRYLIFVHLFGLVDNLGKNARLTTWDGLIWWFQPYDCDTCIALDNSGFQKFDSDIEIGDKNVFNTTSSKLWSKVMLYFPNEIKQMYAQLRNGKLNLDNVLKYLIDDQLKKIPATMYNRDAQTKYLNFGETYLYACHGSSENLIRKWMSDRFKYMDSLYEYDTDNMDFITIRSSKMGKVYIDIQTFSPMYFTIKWRNEADNSGIKRQRVGKGETVRFEYKMPTETDQEIILYGGSNIKDLGDLSNLQPTTLSIGNATRLTRLVCHSSNLVNTDLSACTNLVHVDLSKCTQLGAGVGSQSVLNLTKNPNLLYLNCQDTQITSVNLDPLGSNIQELWLSKTIRSFSAQNCCALKVLGLQYGHNCKSIKLINCPELKSFGNNQWDAVNKRYKYPDAYFLSGIQELYLDEAYDVEKIECLYNPNINNVTLRNLKNTKELTLGPRILIGTDTLSDEGVFRTVYPTQDNVTEYGDFKLTTKNCPNLESFRTRYCYNRNTYPTLGRTHILPGIKYLHWNGNTYYSQRHQQAGFHCNILDLSEVESLKRVDLGITSYINKLLIPSGVTFLRLNPLKDIPDKSPYDGYSANDMSPYYKYKLGYDSGYVYTMSGWGDWDRPCIRANVIYSIATTLDECETNVWKMGSYNLQDFDLGIYNVDQSRDSSHLLTIQDLNLTCHDYSLVLPNVNSINDINGTVDMSNYTGNYLIRTFYGMTDNLQITLPNSYDNIKYVYDTVKELNTVQFDWKFGAFLFEKANNITAFFKNCRLKEQADESEKISFNNSESSGDWVGEENGIFVGANIKWIDEININSARSTQCMFNNNSNIISVGNISVGGPKFTSNSFNRIFRYMFRNAKNLTSVGNVTMDLNNITWNIGIQTSECDQMFNGCSNLKTVGKISFTNANPTQIQKIQSAKDYLMSFSDMFNGCSSLTSDIDFDSGGIPIGGLYNSFNNCKFIKNIKLPNLAHSNNTLNLAGLCAGCSSLVSIDFSRTGTFSATDKINCRYVFSGCKSLTTITEGFDPDNMPEGLNNEIAYDYAFSNCQLLVPYYKLINENGRYCRRETYYNCKSMNIPSNVTIDLVIKYIKNDWGNYWNDTFRLDPQITTATINLRLNDAMKNASPDSDGYINSHSFVANSLFAGCNNLETLNINFEDIKPFKFKEGIRLATEGRNDGSEYRLINLKKLVFNADLFKNIKPNWMSFGGFMNGGKIEYIENYPLNVINDDISMSVNFKNITWSGQITTSYNKEYLKSTYMPQSCLNDFLMNHLGTAATDAILTLGSNKSRASAEALAAATAKGWTIK